MIRNPVVNWFFLGLLGGRIALRVCQAISIAITVVLPAPVANFKAIRKISGSASRFDFFRASKKLLSFFGATSAKRTFEKGHR
jgi:hypothetical protein